MGLPARVREHGATSFAPALRLLRGGAGRTSTSRPAPHASAREIARCRGLFQTTLVLLVVVMGLGMARVQLTVQATEAALAANALKQDIENERIRSEMLEADRIALATPSRIESIAGVSMGMGAAEEVSYLELPAGEAGEDTELMAQPAATVEPSRSSERVAELLAEVMRMTAGEAQVLLVGDAGLASLR